MVEDEEGRWMEEIGPPVPSSSEAFGLAPCRSKAAAWAEKRQCRIDRVNRIALELESVRRDGRAEWREGGHRPKKLAKYYDLYDDRFGAK